MKARTKVRAGGSDGRDGDKLADKPGDLEASNPLDSAALRVRSGLRAGVPPKREPHPRF